MQLLNTICCNKSVQGTGTADGGLAVALYWQISTPSLDHFRGGTLSVWSFSLKFF